MSSSVELKRHLPSSDARDRLDDPLTLPESAEDPSRPARGILVACGISALLWLAIVGILI